VHPPTRKEVEDEVAGLNPYAVFLKKSRRKVRSIIIAETRR